MAATWGFLASDDPRGVTGQDLEASGGSVLGVRAPAGRPARRVAPGRGYAR
ncbi:hypothetical protein [Kitasatospora herbaricolor]|uniref:hypothetical protein n=1 Tax=Kitasatospora herbaricolor TaxID=68217 RepID=UPI0018FE29A3